ncbi:cellulose-binding family II [Catenulispora acidiphila DSM 44928]|uniref:Cellulose-binding family II n=1 Tax=Catenulispora acidiphila (strain DSM 44928 / JCM 14897 / NBRC 102108 / NRRL B-24433 / ID139908) TaxID=479433 RepID=C7QHX6_CATAD|nr:cellulose binding domain-containing protein [Catenulispora acidiphila]ACU73021.1 cellulose-binding family II [Catenulispora acidiphila DSM 44928]
MPLDRRLRARSVALTAATALSALSIVGAVAAPQASAATAVSVTVNGTAGLGTIPGGAIGLNTAVYDSYMNDTPIPGLLKAAGINALRYPGGSYSDIYNWQTNVAQGGYDAPNTSFADFMGTAKAASASPIITVNYGTGTPALAASWVQNAAVTNKDGVAYWEVGNEVYGNGTYGANWETDAHCQTSSGTPVTVGSEPSQTYGCGPSVYANNVLSYMSSMKAVSSNAHVCAILTTPGFWPDNVTNATTSPLPWNQTVLTALGAKTDCVIVHYYPGGSNAAGMLTDTSDISGIISTLHSQISQYAKVNPANVPILVTETNSNVDMDTQPNALFAADMYMTWLENGVANVDWWDEHNGPGTNPPSVVNGAQDYGDYGIFSTGGNNSGVTEPAAETPFGPYYGIAMLSKLGGPGDTMVNSTSSNALVRVHAVRRAGGNLDLLIDNEDPTTSYSVNLAYNGFTPAGSPTVFTFANNGNSITSATQSSASSVTVAPYTLTVVQVPGSGGGGVTAPGAPGQPVVSGLASSTSGNTTGVATLTWPAATAGTYPVASYQVYRQNSGGGTTLAGTTTTTTLNLSGLTIGAGYTYDVVAVDSHGNPSLPSPPVTFTVPPPATASCAVHYAVSSSWSGGFGAAITITNRSATAISAWTLKFTWPDPGEAVQSGWNGTWSQSGSAVTVVNAAWNGTIAANGGTVSLGFNGADTGQDPAPTVFSLNGTVCANN